MRRLAILSLHTSPLSQPGTGDSGGMNVYVRELAAAVARSGGDCDVFTRAWSPELPSTVEADMRHRRAEAEAAIISCSDAVLASCSVEADQIIDLYGADPQRVRIVPLGVDHAVFAPRDRPQAR